VVRATLPAHVQPPAVEHLRVAFTPGEWVAVFLKSYVDGRVAQRVASVEWVASDPVQAWLRAMNAHRFNVYVSVNAFEPGSRNRTRACVAAVRHLFIEADADGDQVLGRIERRSDLPRPSYVLHSSRNRVHVFWRVMRDRSALGWSTSLRCAWSTRRHRYRPVCGPLRTKLRDAERRGGPRSSALDAVHGRRGNQLRRTSVTPTARNHSTGGTLAMSAAPQPPAL